jgi:hypothetical protein
LDSARFYICPFGLPDLTVVSGPGTHTTLWHSVRDRLAQGLQQRPKLEPTGLLCAMLASSSSAQCVCPARSPHYCWMELKPAPRCGCRATRRGDSAGLGRRAPAGLDHRRRGGGGLRREQGKRPPPRARRCDNPPRKIPSYRLNQSTLAIER